MELGILLRVLRNGENDVVCTGAKVIEYRYDSWGKLKSTGTLAASLGQDNPFRYRGYYYDAETGLYYLQSRYYDPEVGRFISADGYFSTTGILRNNMFAYCSNNPIIRCDPSGSAWTYNGISYKYDGSVCDFKRLERGLPPLAYEKAKAKTKSKRKTGCTVEVGQAVSISVFTWTLEFRQTVVFDSAGHIVIQGSKGYGQMISTSPGLGISTATIFTMTNAYDYTNLEKDGLSYSVFGSVPIPYTALSGIGGLSYIETAPDQEGNIYQGGEFVIGGLSVPPSTALNYQWGKSYTNTEYIFK